MGDKSIVKNVYFISDNLIASNGFSTAESLGQMKKGISGIKPLSKSGLDFFGNPLLPENLFVSPIDHKRLDETCEAPGFTPLEKLFFHSVKQSVEPLSSSGNSHSLLSHSKTLLIFSSTKGNINLLEPKNQLKYGGERLEMGAMASFLGQKLGNPNMPIVVSNACISGLLAITLAARLLQAETYETVIVTGGDLLSPFVLSGFLSLKAIGEGPCRPYDETRSGITLGEACATVVMTNRKELIPQRDPVLRYLGGASSNDANHISGPSRTGEGLILAMKAALLEANHKAKIQAGDIDYLSAHGTATLFNDEMESLAFSAMSMENTPTNSLKGYWGHTLGAAGIIESIAALDALATGDLIASKGYSTHGVSKPMNIIRETGNHNVRLAMKTASGFGGCNAAAIFERCE